jgi:hypothetical protein
VQIYLFLAALVTILVGAAHTIIGEVRIFQPMRVNRNIVPINGKPTLKESHLRIIWVSWHVLSVFGWAFAAILFRLAFPVDHATFQAFVLKTIIIAMLVGSLLIFYGTKGRHPGWIGLLVVAVLTWLAFFYKLIYFT